MKPQGVTSAVTLGLVIVTLKLPPTSGVVQAQVWPVAPPPMTMLPANGNPQRTALNNLRSRVKWLQNATRSASNYRTGAVEMLWQQFQFVRASYSAFTATLSAQQASAGANDWAELSAGLDIIQQAFANYQDDLAQGRLPAIALNDLCRLLQEASNVWLQELNRDCARLYVGW